MNRMTSFLLGAALLGIGLIGLAVPERFEGRILVSVSDGHAISVLDAIALGPLVCGVTLLEANIWWGRRQVVRHYIHRPFAGAGLCFLAGMGLGLLLASAFSTFFWWWAIGALAFGYALFSANIVATRHQSNSP